MKDAPLNRLNGYGSRGANGPIRTSEVPGLRAGMRPGSASLPVREEETALVMPCMRTHGPGHGR